MYDLWAVRCWWGERTCWMLFTCRYESTALPVRETVWNHPGFLWPWSHGIHSRRMCLPMVIMITTNPTEHLFEILSAKQCETRQPRRSPGLAFLKAPNLTCAQRLGRRSLFRIIQLFWAPNGLLQLASNVEQFCWRLDFTASENPQENHPLSFFLVASHFPTILLSPKYHSDLASTFTSGSMGASLSNRTW